VLEEILGQGHKAKGNNVKYKVLRDNREQKGWEFPVTANCEGTTEVKLPTGDYTIEGFEKILTIERKGTTGELARNIVEKRFENELVRMEAFPHGFIVLEFTIEDILDFPRNSGIPVKQWPNLKINPWFILKRIVDFDMTYKSKIILAGTKGREVAASIFKRVVERYGQSNKASTPKRRTRKKTS
jgi:hypothetical protein